MLTARHGIIAMEHLSKQAAIDLAARVANGRAVWTHTISLLVERGLLSAADIARMRGHMIDAAGTFAASACGEQRAFGLAGIKDADRLFQGVGACARSDA
jgi:hypothetical protein